MFNFSKSIQIDVINFSIRDGIFLNDSADIQAIISNVEVSIITTPPRDKACSQKRGNVANVRSSRD